MTKYFFWTLVALACLSALAKGGRDERVAAFICLGASLVSVFLQAPLRERFSDVEMGLAGIDVITLAAFVWLALQSPRFWPLWIAGLQLSTIIAHFFKAMDFGLMPRVYAVAERFWSYPIVVIVLVAALSSPWRYAEIERYRDRFAAP
ncbi:hypothetical protein ABDK56_05735 [Sphingomonas sp. ASV193]|uniref:hypothetical protein n=1 Tax=Sphingomonas sp. ASV193 TaxID=3144405 RepID=UPI0032E8F0B6